MNIFKNPLLTLSLLGALASATTGLAEDTDIYANNNGAANNPNVLVIIDNSANWAAANQGWPGGLKQGQSELNALRTVIADLDESVNLGLMLFTPGSGQNKNGGYVRFAVRTMDAANKAAFQEMLGNPAGCPPGANSLNSTPNCIYQNFSSGPNNESVGTAKTDYSATLFEAFKYFGGYTCPAHATDDIAACSTGTVDASHFGALRYAGDPESRSDAAAYSGGVTLPNYESPLSAANSCAKNYVIFIGNGYPTQDSPSTLLSGVGGNATQLSVPDFDTITGVSSTLLGAGAYASQAACEAAAAATYGAAYASYSCSSAGTSTSTTTLATSSCGNYGSQAACETAAATAFPGYNSYSCTVLDSCAGDTALGTSSCGQYSSVAECEAGIAATFPGFTSYTCALSATACVDATTALGTTSCGQYATQAACKAGAATSFPGYASYDCASAGSCTTTDIDGAACYASSAACQSTALVTNPGYNSVSCTSAANCTSVVTTTCAAAGSYSNQSNCDAAAPGILGATYASYTCSQGANCAGGKTWTITGINQSYTATGTGTRWNVSGTDPAGSRYSMVGVGGGSTYTITGTSTTVNWNIYGNNPVTTAVPTGTYSGTSANYADEWAKFLYQTDVNAAAGQQNVRTYAIDVFKDQQDENETALLMSMAAQGGGKYFTATDENSIKNALLKIFSEIQSVNSVFASSSLPVSVNTQGTYLNQVFIGMFRPDGASQPRWAGNLKQYQFDIDAATSSLFLADKNGDAAISATTGFITPCADSIWTTDTGNYWSFNSDVQGSCGAQTSAFPAAGSSSAYSDAPDGDVVEKGGAAQKLRGVTSSGGVLTASSTRYAVCAAGETPATHSCRKLLTCNHLGCSSLLEFSTANAGAASSNPSLTAASLAAVDDTERDLLINWVRGQDIDDENANTVTSEVRPSVHGAVVHSQPAVIDYGGATGVYAFYGADDGVFHAINGNKSDTDGVEAWGFIAPETYGRLQRFRDNEPLVDFPGVNMAITPTPQPKSYFFDGSIGTYQGSGTVWIYPTMRRGGRAVYAFDVSTPTSPTLKWRKGCFTNNTADDSNCSSGWTGIGQTWSKPLIGYLSGYVDGSSNPKPVLIFGGGYDTCEDTDSQTRCAATPRKGANIWFVDADTGAILRTYPTNYSVAGDVFVTRDSGSNVTAIHAVDTGGYLYRINVGSTNADASVFTSWSSNGAATDIDIAHLSEANHARKFVFGPDVVRYPTHNAVLVGTGDREHPLYNDYACGDYSETAGAFVTNQFFMIKDSVGTSYPATLITPSDLTDVTSDTAGGTAIGASGWRFELGQCEQVVNKALAIAGVVYFGTHQPSNTAATACSTNLGTARGYAVNIKDASAVCENCQRSVTYVGGGLPPSPVAGVVEIDGVKVPFLLGGSKPTEDGNCVGEGCSALGGAKIEINPTSARYRVFWYIKGD